MDYKVEKSHLTNQTSIVTSGGQTVISSKVLNHHPDFHLGFSVNDMAQLLADLLNRIDRLENENAELRDKIFT